MPQENAVLYEFVWLVGHVLGHGVPAESDRSQDVCPIPWSGFLLSLIPILGLSSATHVLRDRVAEIVKTVEREGRPRRGQLRALLRPLDQGGVDGLLERFGTGNKTADELLLCDHPIETYFAESCDPTVDQIVHDLAELSVQIRIQGFWRFA